jgi:hypothetical protein
MQNKRSASKTPSHMPPNDSNEPRTKQAIEVVVAIGALGAFHLLCLAIGFADSRFVFGGYFTFSCLMLPIMSIAAVFFPNKKRSWHGGQILMFLAASAIMGILSLS